MILPFHRRWLGFLGSMALVLAIISHPVLAQSNPDVMLELRPPCNTYDDVDTVETEPPANLNDINNTTGTCYPFGEENFETSRTPVLNVGDRLVLDLVINNTEDEVDIAGVGGWLNYDKSVLSGARITINSTMFEPVPGEADFDTVRQIVKIEGSADEMDPPFDPWIPVARIEFVVTAVPNGGKTFLTFADGADAEETFIDAKIGNSLESVLSDDPQALAVYIAAGNGSSASSQSSQGSSAGAKAPGARCGADNECTSNLCYNSVCQTVGFKLDSGVSCRTSDQCRSGVCLASGVCSAAASSQASTVASTTSSVAVSSQSSANAVLVAEGGLCSYSTDCQSGICYMGSCQAASFRIPDGGFCETSAACSTGNCVDNTCVTGTAVSSSASSSGCTANTDCPNGRCVGGICMAQLPDASTCTVNSDCMSGTCTAGICSSAMQLPNGSGCSSNQQCASSLCRQGICSEDQPLGGSGGTLRNPVGAGCLIHEQCQSNLCVEGTCRAADDQQALRTAFALLQIQNLRVTTTGNDVYLSWEKLGSSWLSAYNVYYGSTTGRYLQRKTVTGTDNWLVLRDLPEGTQYYFAVKGVSVSNEESAFSQEVSVVVGNPSTSTAPLTASIPGTDGIGENGVVTGNSGAVPGETGIPTWLALLLVVSATVGTLFASRRQLSVLSIHHS